MAFDAAFRQELHRLLQWRRDVRRFRTTPLAPGTLERLLMVASLAPSVGLSQPWRFVVVADPARRRAVRAHFATCNACAATTYTTDRAARYAALKLEGLERAPTHLAIFADRDTGQGHGLGKQTMPETIDYSAVTAAHTLWLAARAEGIGLGWVSILEPAQISVILETPPSWRLIGYFCIGFPETEDDTPELQRKNWERGQKPVIIHR